MQTLAKNFLNSKYTTTVGILAFALINLYIIYYFFYPIEYYYYGDDWFVLPEKVWFQSNFEWLQHLMILNQRRFTFTGDFMLYRPGLFFIYGVSDILFRTDRQAQQLVLIAVVTSAFYFHYLFLKDYLGKLFAAALCMYTLCLPVGFIIYHWPQLVPYVLALGFFSLGLKYYLKSENDPYRLWKAGFSFFFATLFHEIAVVSIVGYFCAQIVFSWKEKKKLVPLGAPLLAFFSMTTLIATTSSLPVFFDKQHNAINFNPELIQRVLSATQMLVYNLLYFALPFTRIEHESNWVFPCITIGVMVFGSFLLLRQKDKALLKVMLPLMISLFGVIAGVLVGRVAPRGSFAPYYFVLMLYFLLPIVAISYAKFLSKQKWRVISVVTLLTISNFAYVEARNATDPSGPLKVYPHIELVSEISKALKNQPDRCFGGGASTNADVDTNYLLNIAFSNEACKENDGKKPTVFMYRQPDLKQLIQAKVVGKTGEFHEAIIANSKSTEALASTLFGFGFNIVQAKARSPYPKEIVVSNLILSTGPVSGFEFEVVSSDSYPVLYNFGFEIGQVNGDSTIVIFHNNNMDILTKQATVRTSLPDISSNLRIRIIRDGGYLFILNNNQVLMQFPNGFKNDSYIHFLTFDNGTPGEKITKLAEFLPTKSVDVASGELQYFVTDTK